MDIKSKIKKNILDLEYIDWGNNTPKDAIRLQFGENSELFPLAAEKD